VPYTYTHSYMDVALGCPDKAPTSNMSRSVAIFRFRFPFPYVQAVKIYWPSVTIANARQWQRIVAICCTRAPISHAPAPSYAAPLVQFPPRFSWSRIWTLCLISLLVQYIPRLWLRKESMGNSSILLRSIYTMLHNKCIYMMVRS